MLDETSLSRMNRMLLRWSELRAGVEAEPGSSDIAWLAPPRPYPGLRAFSPDEGNVFFARDREIAVFLERLERSSVIVVLGGSGSGKSSLVRAGLIPRLAGGTQVPGRPGGWYTMEFRPAEDPNAGLVRGICDGLLEPLLAAAAAPGSGGERALRSAQALLGSAEAGDDADRLRRRAPALLARRLFGAADPDRLRDARLDPRALFALASERLDAADAELRGGLRVGPPNLLVLIDQFEEAFRPGLHPHGVRNLADLLHAVSDRQPPGLFLVVTMRSEETHRAAEAGLAELLTESAIHLGPLDRPEDRQRIICAPAAAVLDDWLPGWRDEVSASPTAPFAPEVVTHLLAESQAVLEGSQHGSDQLPMLQHALLRLWDVAAARWQREGTGRPEIGAADLEAALGQGPNRLDACLETHAEEAYAAACEAAAAAFPAGPDAPRHAEAIAFVALCSLAARDDRNNWARRFAFADRVAELASDDGEARPAERSAAIAFLEEMRGRGFLNRTKPPGQQAARYDVSHEALIRRWPRLRDGVLRQAERLAVDLYEVDQNIERELAEAAAPHADGARQGRPAVRARAALEAARRLLDGARDFAAGVGGAWRAGGDAPAAGSRPGWASYIPVRRARAACAWALAWYREVPERRASETVPARVRGSLDAVLASDGPVPRRLAASLLADQARLRDPAAVGDLKRVDRMEQPWRLARAYARRWSTRPIKGVFLLTTLGLVLLSVYVLEVARRQTLEQDKHRLEAASLSAGIRQVAAEVLRGSQGGDSGRLPSTVAFELAAAHDWLTVLREHVARGRARYGHQLPDEQRDLVTGQRDYQRAAAGLEPATRRFQEALLLRLAPADAVSAEPACLSVVPGGGSQGPLLREVAGHLRGLRWDAEAGWGLLAGRGEDLRPARDPDRLAGWLPPGNAGGPQGGVVCLSADASLLLSWAKTEPHEERLPQVFTLRWFCEEADAGRCERWAARFAPEMPPAAAVFQDVAWRDPSAFGRRFRTAREREMDGMRAIALVPHDPKAPRAGFVLDASEGGRLVVDAGRSSIAQPIPPMARETALLPCGQLRGSGASRGECYAAELADGVVQVVPTPDRAEGGTGPTPHRVRVEVILADRNGTVIASGAYLGARAEAVALTDEILAIRDAQGLWWGMSARSPDIEDLLRPFAPSEPRGAAANSRDGLSPAYRDYRCDDALLLRSLGQQECLERREGSPR